ncbi:TRAP transporter substrate-binding protein DctP [Chloroflexota bacterium]
MRLGSVILVLIMALVLFASACVKTTPSPEPPAPTPSAEPIVLKAVTGLPEAVRGNWALFHFIDIVNERGKGELIIDYLGGPEVIGTFDQAMSVRTGVVDMSHVFSAAYSGLVSGVESLPYSQLTFEEEETGPFYDLMFDEHKKAGLIYLGRASNPQPTAFFGIWLNVKVDTLADMAGLKIGGISPQFNRFLQVLGAAPVVMAPGEQYSALERGVVDGVWDATEGPVPGGWYEVVKYFLNHRFGGNNMVYIINPDTWNRLSQSQQNLLIEAKMETERWIAPLWEEQINSDMDIWRESEIEFIMFPPEDAERFTETMYQAGWEELMERYPDITPKLKELLTK